MVILLLGIISVICLTLSLTSLRGNKRSDELKDLKTYNKEEDSGKLVVYTEEKEKTESVEDKTQSVESAKNTIEKQIQERRESWLKAEQIRRCAEEQVRERKKIALMQKEEQKKATLQRIKDALQWNKEDGVYTLVYQPIDSECLYMDSLLENGIVDAGEVGNIVFRYGYSDLKVKNLTIPCRGVLTVCLTPFYQHSYEILPGATVFKIDCNEARVTAYEQQQIEMQLAEDRATKLKKELEVATLEEEAKLHQLKREEREKERIRRQLLAQKKRRELERKVQQEMYERGELAMEGTKRRYIPHSVVSEVYRRDGAKCVICGSVENLQLDHIIPFSKGGADTAENLQVLCQKCNLKKSNKI